MPATPVFADIHCHPTFKPYGQSFSPGTGCPEPAPADVISLWHESDISGTDAFLSEKFSVAMYTQSNLIAAARGGAQVMGVSIGALEQEFITINRPLPKTITDIIRLGTGGSADAQNFLINLVTRFGTARLNKVRAAAAYFPDLLAEAAFLKAQEGRVFPVDGRYYTYRIAQNGAAIADTLARNAASGAGLTPDKPITICVFLTMEGLHNLDAGHGATETAVLDHVKALKSGAAGPLFFVTVCHHFWNGLCGHARSLAGLMAAVFDQTAHVNEGLSPLGLKVLMALLDDKAGRRILIDMKHMSYKARTQYFNLLAGAVPQDLTTDATLLQAVKTFFRFNNSAASGLPATPPPPPIISHAAVNGYGDESNKTYGGNYPAQGADGVLNPFENSEIFSDPAINFYDADLINIARFRGLIGIQLDAHRIAGPYGLEVAKARTHSHAWLMWNQVLHMAELWDRMGYDGAWDRICIGSDFDGIICPLDGLPRASDLPALREGLLYYSRLYFLPAAQFAQEKPGMGERGIIANRFQKGARNPSGKRLNPAGPNAPEQTGLAFDAIVDKICSGNAAAFLKKWFV